MQKLETNKPVNMRKAYIHQETFNKHTYFVLYLIKSTKKCLMEKT